MNFERLDISAVVDDQLQEEFVDWLEMWPGWIYQELFLLLVKYVTSSMPTPSPGRPAFLRMGKGLKIFFSIILMTRSRWGIMTVDMHVGSARRSLNSWR